jgi:hypothetical protein
MLEAALALASASLAVLTVVWPDWIEAISGFAPDRHDGSFEWMLAAGLALAAVTCAALARREWRRRALALP